MNPLYEIINKQYIQQKSKREEHFRNIYEVQQSVKALKDFLDSVDKIEAPYRQIASDEYCLVLIDYMKKHNII